MMSWLDGVKMFAVVPSACGRRTWATDVFCSAHKRLRQKADVLINP
jgi:hypothetical protein